jgi:hypothetical protein
MLRPLLEGVIDYAGLFPPAKLPMGEALSEYLRHYQSKEDWIMDRFLCPVGRLGELAQEIEKQGVAVPFGVSVIGSGGDGDLFFSNLDADRKAIDAFRAAAPAGILIDGYETKPGDPRAAAKALKGLAPLEVFVEVPNAEAVHVLAEHEGVGAKLRTGGLEREAIPSAELVADFLKECVDLDLEFKLTAGLHHPFRNYNETVMAKMHGFLNVLIAAVLAETNDLNRFEIATILEEEDPEMFEITDLTLGWSDYVTTDVDAPHRIRELFIGFGSCSVQEPVDDLKALGLWGGAL